MLAGSVRFPGTVTGRINAVTYNSDAFSRHLSGCNPPPTQMMLGWRVTYPFDCKRHSEMGIISTAPQTKGWNEK